MQSGRLLVALEGCSGPCLLHRLLQGQVERGQKSVHGEGWGGVVWVTGGIFQLDEGLFLGQGLYLSLEELDLVWFLFVGALFFGQSVLGSIQRFEHQFFSFGKSFLLVLLPGSEIWLLHKEWVNSVVKIFILLLTTRLILLIHRLLFLQLTKCQVLEHIGLFLVSIGACLSLTLEFDALLDFIALASLIRRGWRLLFWWLIATDNRRMD